MRFEPGERDKGGKGWNRDGGRRPGRETAGAAEEGENGLGPPLPERETGGLRGLGVRKKEEGERLLWRRRF